MDLKLAWWNKKHHKYAKKDWINKTSVFAKWVIKHLPKTGKILDLGAGHGQDTRFFASRGYQIVSTDFSDTALEYNKIKLPTKYKDRVKIIKHDSSVKYPFNDDTFDVVYSHQSIHYFNEEFTQKIFDEVHRVLKTGGVFALLTNSTHDPEYGIGKKLGKDYFELEPGDVKRFFSVKSLGKFTNKFHTLVLDNKGTTHKDTAKGVFNLIRFVGRKK